MSTIAAISTPLAAGGISVLRISGDNALNIISKIFIPVSSKKVSEMKGHTCVLGKVYDEDILIDEAILTVFLAPKSYTGENVCEISCHGGIFVTKKILEVLLKKGCELAQAGEFTKRAFLNGKLSLTQAEAVIDTINAQNQQALRSANNVREGKLFQRIQQINSEILSILSELSVWVDYPDEDIADLSYEDFILRLEKIINDFENLSKEYETGKIIREGVQATIIGKPNVGKSTLMNMLLGYNRSIVTDIEGTTRDIVEENLQLGDLILRISDTAGIRETSDKVEEIGVSLAEKKIEQADLVIAVFDNSSALNKNDLKLISLVNEKPSIAVINKLDLEKVLERDVLEEKFNFVIEISAINGEGKALLTDALAEIFKLNEFNINEGIISNERQKNCLFKAFEDVKMVHSALLDNQTFDVVNVLLDRACQYLLELSGERITDAVVDRIFEDFCVGK